MNIVCDRQTLCEAVQNVGRAVSGKSSIPALEGILLTAKDNALHLCGYDLEMGITTSIEAKVNREGSMILPARLFADVARLSPDERVTIDCDDKLTTLITSGSSEFSLLAIPAGEYPDMPQMSGESVATIGGGALKSMIGQTLFAIATSDVKPVHTGSLFEIEDNLVTIVSVDGFRLALRREAAICEGSYRFVLPGKMLSEVQKLIKDDDEQVSIHIAHKHVVLQMGRYNVVSRTLEGDFLDYKGTISQKESSSIVVSRREFAEALERVSLLISDRLKSPLRVKFAAASIAMSCITPIGRAHDEIGCRLTGDEVEMGFNHKYLQDAVRYADCDEIKLEMNGPLSPMRVEPLEGGSFLFLVLPVRLKSDEG